MTARGVVTGMEAALEFNNNGTLEGKEIVLQGCGNVASFIVEGLLQKGVKKITASDINPNSLEVAEKRFNDKRVEFVLSKPGCNSILFKPCDIVVPSALGGILNKNSIPKISAKIVCGAANNQLLDPATDDKLLLDHGISYVPDFLCNRMGIVNCANEMVL
jgi:leucine dehydrogenase